MVIFLFISLISLYPSNIAVSYGQAGLYSDSPLIAYTTDCMASMMTNTIVGSPQDCTENISKVNPPSDDASNIITPENTTPNAITPENTTPNAITPENTTPNAITPENTTPNSMDSANSLSKNNPFYSEFQNTNADTSSLPATSLNSPDNGFASTDSTSPPADNPATSLNSPDNGFASTDSTSPPADNPATSLNSPDNGFASTDSTSPPADNPATSMSSLQQNPNSSNVIPASPIESLDGKNNTNISSSEINELGNLVDKNNENGEEISGCFDRASVPDATLSNSEIIKCAEDHESFSNENNVNLDVSDEGKTDGNDDESDNARIKEISACFDRAFAPDANLSDLEIIKCAEDRDSFSTENSANLDVSDDGNDNDGNNDGNDNDGNNDGNDNDGNNDGNDNDGNNDGNDNDGNNDGNDNDGNNDGNDNDGKDE